MKRYLPGVFALAAVFTAAPLEAQLFNGGGLFNRKTEAPRAQTEDEIGVPVPVTGRVEALKGNEVQFEIRAESKTPGASVEFLIRTFPSAGKIVSLVSNPNARNKAVVTYFADPASSATSDAFSFAVRYRGGRYSAEMRYDIDLVDLKTEIQAPTEIDFGEVTVGSESVREITVRNLGSGSMERQLFLAPPWHLLDPADGRVAFGPRGGRVLKIAFRPELTGETSYFLSFSRSKEGTTKLIGRGAEAFTVASETLELVLDEATGERRGEIELVNSGAKAVLVEARASTRLESGILEGYVLAPGQTTKVPVKLAATDTAPFDGTVEFFLKNGYAKAARVIAPVVPGRIVVSVPDAISSEVINFGKVEAGRSTERGITLTNRGGVSVPLEFHIPEPFRLLTNPGPQLGPLSSVSISLGLFPTSAQRGLVDVTMNVYGTEQEIPIRLLGNIVAPAREAGTRPAASNLPAKGFRLGSGRTPAAISTSSDLPEPAEPADGTDPLVGFSGTASGVPAGAEAEGGGVGRLEGAGEGGMWYEGLTRGELDQVTSPLGFVSRPIIERKIDLALRRPEDLAVFKSGSNSLQIGWTAPKDTGPSHFEVEVRGLALNSETGMPESVWAPFPAVKIERIDRLVKANLDRLNPASQYELRVILLTEDGRSSLPSEAIVAQTTLPMDWTYIYLTLGIFLLGALAYGGWRIYLARRPEVYQSRYVEL